MNLALLIFWGAVGWCGTPWPRRWPLPPKPPTPDTWWFAERIVGIIGGIAAGGLFVLAWPLPTSGDMVALTTIATGAVAFVGSVILSDLYFAFVVSQREPDTRAEEMKTARASE